MLRRAAYAIFVLSALVGLGMLLWPAPAPKDMPQTEFVLLDGGKTSLAERITYRKDKRHFFLESKII